MEMKAIREFVYQLLAPRIQEKGKTWLDEQLDRFKSGNVGNNFFFAFSGASRFVGKDALALTTDEIRTAQALRKGLCPQTWSIDQACRILFLLHLPQDEKDKFKQRIMDLLETADLQEQKAIYAALPLLPYPEQYVDLATEGLRSNITEVFHAIALNNPYPADYFERGAWNQMYLKAAFIDAPLYQIYGVEKRANAELARIISDYAHERWAAQRIVSPEIWRPVVKFVNLVLLEDLKKLFIDREPLQRMAAALVCKSSDHDLAQELLAIYPEWKSGMGGEMNWESLGKAWEMHKKLLVAA